MDETQVALIAEQLRHAISLLQAQINTQEAELGHLRELCDQRLAALERQAGDHETRLRAATDGVTQFKMWSGLASAGSGLVSLIALVKAFFTGLP